ncbi:MAG: heat shock protein HspQ [Rhodospirillaceae bacterium]|nr:heat shock protein HspQ [Rhodospirillaceae bacterium]
MAECVEPWRAAARPIVVIERRTAAAPQHRAGTMHIIAKFAIGQVVRHRLYPFRGVIFDVDPEFANTEEWWQSIPEEVRPRKDQPFYHLLAENAETTYTAYVSEQNLVPDDSGKPVGHPKVKSMFGDFGGDHYEIRKDIAH